MLVITRGYVIELYHTQDSSSSGRPSRAALTRILSDLIDRMDGAGPAPNNLNEWGVVLEWSTLEFTGAKKT